MVAQSMIDTFRRARMAAAPLVGIATPDQQALIGVLVEELGRIDADVNRPMSPVVRWDMMRGVRGANEPGTAAASRVPSEISTDFCSAVASVTVSLPDNAVMICVNVHRIIGDVPVSTALQNMRDAAKATGRMVVLLGPSLELPDELKNDVVMLDEEMPDDAALAGVVDSLYASAGGTCNATTRAACVTALRGLPLFAAETAAAMAMTTRGIDSAAAWHAKARMIEQTPGLSVSGGGETFDGLGGLDSIKAFCRHIVDSRRFSAVLYIDEIEKALAGHGTDTSGVAQDQVLTLLTFMQDYSVPGLLLLGQPGSGKSAIAKSLGAAMGVPTVRFDLGAMMGGLVGDSQRMIRGALKVVRGVAAGRIIIVGTCNDVGVLERLPEMMRRFSLGRYFFDLPTADERETIWPLALARHGLALDSDRPDDSGWSGAEIVSACEIAALLNISVSVAARHIVPMAVAQQRMVQTRREQASGRFLNASAPGIYIHSHAHTDSPASGRAMLAQR